MPHWDWFAVFALTVIGFLLMRIGEKLDRITRELERLIGKQSDQS